MAVFRQKVHLSRRKSATEFLYMKTVSDRVVKHSLAYLPCKNRCWWTSPFTSKFRRKRPTSFKNAAFQSIFFCIASTVTSIENV